MDINELKETRVEVQDGFFEPFTFLDLPAVVSIAVVKQSSNVVSEKMNDCVSIKHKIEKFKEDFIAPTFTASRHSLLSLSISDLAY